MDASKDLHQQAYRVLMTANPAAKIELGQRLQKSWLNGEMFRDHQSPVLSVEDPGRPLAPLLVDIRELPRRGLGSESGRAALVHAITHIEYNAINLAWDAVYRYRNMPDDFYHDWIRVAIEESQHFQLLEQRLLGLGYEYGSFNAHDGLWCMARRTAHDVMHRMALVPRVLEARGLDVTPGMLAGLRKQGDQQTVVILEQILREEIGHVAIGSHWYQWLCEQRAVEPMQTFRQLLLEYGVGGLRQPVNIEARRQAGFSEQEMDGLLEDMHTALNLQRTDASAEQ